MRCISVFKYYPFSATSRGVERGQILTILWVKWPNLQCLRPILAILWVTWLTLWSLGWAKGNFVTTFQIFLNKPSTNESPHIDQDHQVVLQWQGLEGKDGDRKIMRAGNLGPGDLVQANDLRHGNCKKYSILYTIYKEEKEWDRANRKSSFNGTKSTGS